MKRHSKAERQAVVDEYLSATGCNHIVPADFLDWLHMLPDHPFHAWMFANTDAEDARSYRLGKVRSLLSGLSVHVVMSVMPATSTIEVEVVTVPVFISPVDGRANRGGYYGFDSTDERQMSEFIHQAAVSLKSWADRFGGGARIIGVDVAPVEEIVALLRRHVLEVADKNAA